MNVLTFWTHYTIVTIFSKWNKIQIYDTEAAKIYNLLTCVQYMQISKGVQSICATKHKEVITNCCTSMTIPGYWWSSLYGWLTPCLSLCKPAALWIARYRADQKKGGSQYEEWNKITRYGLGTREYKRTVKTWKHYTLSMTDFKKRKSESGEPWHSQYISRYHQHESMERVLTKLWGKGGRTSKPKKASSWKIIFTWITSTPPI